MKCVIRRVIASIAYPVGPLVVYPHMKARKNMKGLWRVVK
jgi:hypothetical protein